MAEHADGDVITTAPAAVFCPHGVRQWWHVVSQVGDYGMMFKKPRCCGGAMLPSAWDMLRDELKRRDRDAGT